LDWSISDEDMLALYFMVHQLVVHVKGLVHLVLLIVIFSGLDLFISWVRGLIALICDMVIDWLDIILFCRLGQIITSAEGLVSVKGRSFSVLHKSLSDEEL
jgi:hypothetical protein